MCKNSSSELVQELNLGLSDLEFCEKAQQMYETTYELYLEYEKDYEKAMEVFYNLDLLDSLRFSGLRIGKFSLEDKLLVLQREFMCVIADYFNNKYSLELSARYVKDILIVENGIDKIKYNVIVEKIYDILGIRNFKEHYINKIFYQMHKYSVPMY